VKRIFLTIAFGISSISGYSQTPSDTTFKDITGEYNIVLPSLNEFTELDIGALWEFKVAIIALELVGKKNIKWTGDTTELPHSSEPEFEKEMLNCRGGYFLNHDFTEQISQQATAIKKTTYCMTNYCRRTEPQGYNMGTSYYTDYISFEKLNCLIIFRINYTEYRCVYRTELELINECERDKKRKNLIREAFNSFVADQLLFSKIGNK